MIHVHLVIYMYAIRMYVWGEGGVERNIVAGLMDRNVAALFFAMFFSSFFFSLEYND